MKAPKLRFPNFNDEWLSIKLGKLLEFNNGINADKNSYGKGRKFINVLDILNNENIVYEKIKGSVEVDAKTESNNKVEYGDIVFLRSSETREDVGKCSVYLDEKEYSLFGGFVIRGKKIAEYNPYFLKLNLETPLVRHQIGSKSGGSTRFNVSQGILNSIEIKMPNISEQKKISKFIDTFNKKIQLQQQKIDLLQEQKKGFLQKMFPKAGETQPEMRFDGFIGDWKLEKLGKLVTIHSGWSPSNFEENHLGELFIKVDDLNYSSRVQIESNMKVTSHSKYKKMKKGSIIFPKRGAAIMTNKVRILGKDGYMDTNMMSLEPNGVDNDFLYTFLDKTGLYKIADTSTIPQINNKHIDPYEIMIPELEEQIVIGMFFKKLDISIDVQQKRLKFLQKQKQGFMQQMFI